MRTLGLLGLIFVSACDGSGQDGHLPEVPVLRDVVVTIDAPDFQRVTLGTSVSFEARVTTAAGLALSGYSARWIGADTDAPLPIITVPGAHNGVERVVLAPTVVGTFRVKLEVITACRTSCARPSARTSSQSTCGMGRPSGSRR